MTGISKNSRVRTSADLLRGQDLREVLSPKALEVLSRFSVPRNRKLRKSDINAAFIKDAFLRALQKTRGNVSAACEAIQVSRRTYDNYLINDPIFSELVAEIREATIDYVEDKLLNNIERGWEASIIFFLKTRGRKRGYSESGSDAQSYEESVLQSQVESSDEAIIQEIQALRERLNVDDLSVGGFNIDDYEIVDDLEEDEELVDYEDIIIKAKSVSTDSDLLRAQRVLEESNEVNLDDVLDATKPTSSVNDLIIPEEEDSDGETT